MGTLGRPLKQRLEEKGHDVWGADLQHQADQKYYRADVSNYRQMERVFEQDYDYVYHLAAEFGRINGEEYYDTLWETNVIGTRNILELQKRKKFKLIFASSSEIYGDKHQQILAEDQPWTFLYSARQGVVINKRLQNAMPSPWIGAGPYMTWGILDWTI